MSSPFLERYFASLERFFFEYPTEPGRLIAEYPGWEADTARLAIYGRFVTGHVRKTVGKVFSGCKALTADDVWADWVTAYYRRRPAKHYRINQAAAGFIEFLSEQPDLPPYLLELARFEWTKIQVYYSETELPSAPEGLRRPHEMTPGFRRGVVVPGKAGRRDSVASSVPEAERSQGRRGPAKAGVISWGRLSVNPTLVTLEHEYQICASYRQRERDPRPPERGDEIVFVWRDPSTRLARYQSASPEALLVLKLALEGIESEQAAAEGGVPLETVQAAIAEQVSRGLVLLG